MKSTPLAPLSPSRRTTLRARMTLSVTLLCLGVLTLAGVTVYLGARAALQQNLDNALLSVARAEIASAIDEPGGKVHIHNEEPGDLTLTSGSGYEKFAQIENNADQIIALTSNLAAAPLRGEPGHERRARAGIASFGDLRRGSLVLRALYYPLHDARGNPLITICAISTAHLQQSLRSLRDILVSILIGGGLLAALGANRLARRLTMPLEQIAQEARAIDEDCLNRRLSFPSEDVELHDLAEILNAMIARLESAFAVQQRVMEAQRRFLADASHELRSPVANLRGTIEVVLRRSRTIEEYREALELSMGETERLSRLVNDLMTLSRADTGQFSLEFASCDLAEIARRSALAHEDRAEAAHLWLQIEGEEVLPVWGDAHRLRQIVDNLLDNALQYAPPESAVVIQVRRDGASALVSIRDEGAGLSPEEQAAIFDRFYRADHSRARHTGGLGLGLTIARTLAEAHEGSLTVQSAPGQGAVFTLRLSCLLDA